MPPQGSQSPFPGMDPYLEDEALWPEFHRRLVGVIRELLSSRLGGVRYEVVIGQRRFPAGAEDYLEIRQRSDGGLVTLVDVVSPANKMTNPGRQAYLEQRRQAADSKATLVEIDLLLQGQPTLDYPREGLPEWRYAVTVTPGTYPGRHEIYLATLQTRLPRFRLPLAPDDRDSVLDLQAAFARCYTEGGYSGRIDYRREPAVPLGAEDRRWLDAALAAQGLRAPSPPQEEVAVAAYFIWERQGCPSGRDKEHWHRALAELRAGKGGE
jgi:hypothetical protein